jgi:uncharacterized protein involved in exopolysaccharide biosynthesis
MQTAMNESVHEEPEGEEGDGGFDLQAAKDLLGFALRAPRRRPFLALSIVLVVAGLGLTIAATMPRVYNATVKLFAQRTSVLPAVGTNRQAREEDYPMRNVADVIRQHDNMVDLLERTSLVERFYAERSPALRLKDQFFAAIGAPLTEDDKKTAVLATLDKKLTVIADADSVTISVDWFDAKATLDVAAAIEQNLLEARYDSEVAMISDAVGLLEQHAKAKATKVDEALAEYVAQRERLLPDAAEPDTSSGMPGQRRAPIARRASGGAAASSADTDVARELEETRQRIRSLEDGRQRQVDSVRDQLRQAQLTLTPQHPTVIGLQRALEGLSEPSPQLAELKAQEKKFMSVIVAPGAPPAVAPAGGATPAGTPAPLPAPSPAASASRLATENEVEKSPALAPARQHLESAVTEYQEASNRVDGAKLELELARRAVAYRYRVITPPELPRKTKKPMALIVGAGSLIAGVLFALVGSTLADLLGGVLLETWQVRRQLKLDVLSVIDGRVEHS